MTLHDPVGRRHVEAAGAWPDFLIVGATKCGTTSLHAWLSRHPQTFMHPWKEMRFFLDAGRWGQGTDWYRGQFAAARGRVAGEASNGYARQTEHPGTAKRIARHLPNARLVYLVREPFARMISHYRHRLATGREWRAPDRAFADDPGYVDTGRYGHQLSLYREHFAAEQILVIQAEALFRDPGPHLKRLARHLGVEPAPDLPFRAENVSAPRPIMPAALRRLGAIPPARDWLKRAARGPWAGLVGARPPAGSVPVPISGDLRARIAEVYARDRERLVTLAGADVAEWPAA